MSLRRIRTIASTLILASSTVAQLGPGEVRAQVKLTSDVGLDLAGKNRVGGELASMGDLDGDGVDDLATSCQAGPNTYVVLLFMNRDGSIKFTTQIGAVDIPGSPLVTGYFATGIASLGDVDGDGMGDIAVGDPGDSSLGPYRGAVWVLFLDDQPGLLGKPKAAHKIDAPAGVDDDDYFGWALASLDDLDGDGKVDLAVGAIRDDDGFLNNGAVWILFLDTDGSVLSTAKVSNATGGFAGALENVDELLGTAITSLDLDGDGRRELAVGVPQENDWGCADGGGVDSGAVFVWFLESDGSVSSYEKISASPSSGGTVPFGSLSEGGTSLACPGDVDGDGVPDLAVGAPRHDASFLCPLTPVDPRGSAWVLFMRPDGTVKDGQRISRLDGSFEGPLGVDSRFGQAVAPLGDLDGDGKVDLAVGAHWDDELSAYGGAIWILFLEGAATQPPFVPFNAALDGRPGRVSVVTDPGTDLSGGGIIVVPKTESSYVLAEMVQAIGGESITFAPTSGDGQFATGEFPTQAAYVSFNPASDGVADVLTSNRGDGSISLLIAGTDGLGQFDGTFQDHVDTFATMGGNGAFVAMGVGDFDGDLVTDVVAAGSAGLTVFLADPGGTGSLVEYDFVAVADLVDLALGDVDQDGDLDVVAASGAVADTSGGMPVESGEVTVILNDGTGDLSIAATFAAGTAKASVLLAPFDGDADPDLIVVTHAYDAGPGGVPQAEIELYLGAPGATFGASPLTGATFPSADGIHPTFGGTADLDGDGDLDVVYTSSDNVSHPPGTFGENQPPLVLTVLLNQGAGSPLFAAPLIQGTAYSGKGVAPVLQDLVNDPGLGAFVDCVLVFYQDTLAGQDVDGDFTTNLALLLGNGDGTFSDPTPNQFLTGDEPGDGDVGDLDGPAKALAGTLDVVVPNLGANSVTVLFTDGHGTVASSATVAGVDDTMPPVGPWQGGPRSARFADLDADGDLDILTYNLWQDVSGIDPTVYASVSLFDGGRGLPFRMQWLPLARGGEAGVVDVTLDGQPDVVVTERLGSGGTIDVVEIYRGLPGVAVDAFAPLTVQAPAGHELTGGLLLGDITADGAPDVVTTSRDTSTGEGHVLVYPNTKTPPASGLGAPILSPMGVTWSAIRSIDVRNLVGDGKPDVAVGERDGRLFLAAGAGGGSFVPASSNPVAALVGGGAIKLGDVNGDDKVDIVSSNGSSLADSGEAYVRTLVSQGGGAFLVEQVDGLASTTPSGDALAPLLADMNGDGATDVVLVHGAAGSLSIVLNDLNGFSVTTPGTAGSTGVVPTLTGLGYSAPGGHVQLVLEHAPGEGIARLHASGPAAAAVADAWSIEPGTPVAVEGGPPGAPGAGSLSITATLPVDPALVGLWVDLVVTVTPPFVPAPGGSVGTPGSSVGSGSTGSRSAAGAIGGPKPGVLDVHRSNGLRMEIR